MSTENTSERTYLLEQLNHPQNEQYLRRRNVTVTNETPLEDLKFQLRCVRETRSLDEAVVFGKRMIVATIPLLLVPLLVFVLRTVCSVRLTGTGTILAWFLLVSFVRSNVSEFDSLLEQLYAKYRNRFGPEIRLVGTVITTLGSALMQLSTVGMFFILVWFHVLFG